MRAALPLMLFLALTTSAPRVSAQATLWQNAPDPIHQSIKRESTRLAADKPGAAGDSVGEPAPSDWSRVRKLARGTKLRVTNKGEQPRRWTFEEADDFQITVHDPGGVQRMIARSEVAEITAFGARGSLGGAIGGAVLGAWVGGAIALNLGLSVQCQPHCGGVEGLMILSSVGVPIAAGVLGYRAFRHPTEELIYWAP